MLENLLRRTLLDELTICHEDHAVAHLTGEAHLMGDADHRHALMCELLHNLEYLADHLRVERTRRLIEEHDLRVHAECTHDRHTLLLTT